MIGLLTAGGKMGAPVCQSRPEPACERSQDMPFDLISRGRKIPHGQVGVVEGDKRVRDHRGQIDRWPEQSEVSGVGRMFGPLPKHIGYIIKDLVERDRAREIVPRRQMLSDLARDYRCRNRGLPVARHFGLDVLRQFLRDFHQGRSFPGHGLWILISVPWGRGWLGVYALGGASYCTKWPLLDRVT